MSRRMSDAEVLQAVLDSKIQGLHVAMPATVIAFNPSKNTVDVAPGFKRVVEDEETGELDTEDHPTIPDVPVAWPRGGGQWITWPLAKGDPVSLVFQDFDPAMWRATGQATSPGDLRSHALGNAVAHPGITKNAARLTSAQIASNAVCIGSNVLLGSTAAAQAMVLGNAFKALYDAHVHPTAFGPSGPTSPLAPTALSTKHKLDS